jgi:hypothetical protein
MILEIQIMLGWKQWPCKFNYQKNFIHRIKTFRHFHDETGQLTNQLNLNAGMIFQQKQILILSFLFFIPGDDAEKVVWCPVDRTLELYACHKDLLKAAVDRLDAFW